MQSTSKWENSGKPSVLTGQEQKEHSWLLASFPSWQKRAQGPHLEEWSNLSSTLAQGEKAKGPKCNHHFYIPGGESSSDSGKKGKSRTIFFSHLNVSVI